jgi:predicted transcriptional regulator
MVKLKKLQGILKRSILTTKLRRELHLLERHILMLKTIQRHQPIGIIRLSSLLKLPQHKIRYSMRILEQDGLIKPSVDGAVVTEKMRSFLRHLKNILKEMNGTIVTVRRSVK